MTDQPTPSPEDNFRKVQKLVKEGKISDRAASLHAALGTAPTPSPVDELREILQEKLLLVLLKAKVTPGTGLIGYNFELPDVALDETLAAIQAKITEARLDGVDCAIAELDLDQDETRKTLENLKVIITEAYEKGKADQL